VDRHILVIPNGQIIPDVITGSAHLNGLNQNGVTTKIKYK
jgi:L-lactate utilization protein LutC